MFRVFVVVASSVTVFFGIAVPRSYGRAGNIGKPRIAVAAHDGLPDAACTATNAVLKMHEKDFVGGHYINAYSVLHFAGGSKTINSLLADLSKIDGAMLQVRFRSDTDLTRDAVSTGDESKKDYDCTIEHNAWTNGHLLTISIYLGDNLRIDDVSLPVIRGQADDNPQ